MKAQLEFDAAPRTGLGKSAARAVRRSGNVPVAVYGKAKETVNLTLDANKLSREYFRGGFMNKLVALKAGSKTYHVIPRDVLLNPISDKIEHADFMHVDDKSQIKVFVPVHFLNVEKSVGIKRGGVLNIVEHSVELICNVNAIPSFLEIDVINLNIGDSVHISTVKLPQGVTPAIKSRDFTIASIAGRMAEEEVATTAAVAPGEVPAAAGGAPVAAAGAAAAAPAKGAAPAAGAAAPAKGAAPAAKPAPKK
ncbi:MAG: 50S ribosomal protein L25/general stress protein Ctc [Alphaproteobacteria bacterium]|jgi:large subunit ribosomal protein L25|nr:50S ribosomal protein L25/general stress protein Ctc [Rickettsiales bacterium]